MHSILIEIQIDYWRGHGSASMLTIRHSNGTQTFPNHPITFHRKQIHCTETVQYSRSIIHCIHKVILIQTAEYWIHTAMICTIWVNGNYYLSICRTTTMHKQIIFVIFAFSLNIITALWRYPGLSFVGYVSRNRTVFLHWKCTFCLAYIVIMRNASTLSDNQFEPPELINLKSEIIFFVLRTFLLINRTLYLEREKNVFLLLCFALLGCSGCTNRTVKAYTNLCCAQNYIDGAHRIDPMHFFIHKLLISHSFESQLDTNFSMFMFIFILFSNVWLKLCSRHKTKLVEKYILFSKKMCTHHTRIVTFWSDLLSEISEFINGRKLKFNLDTSSWSFNSEFLWKSFFRASKRNLVAKCLEAEKIWTEITITAFSLFWQRQYVFEMFKRTITESKWELYIAFTENTSLIWHWYKCEQFYFCKRKIYCIYCIETVFFGYKPLTCITYVHSSYQTCWCIVTKTG